TAGNTAGAVCVPACGAVRAVGASGIGIGSAAGTRIAPDVRVVAAGEALHHIPGLEYLNVPSGEGLPLQFAALCAAALIYAAATALACSTAKRRFERIDL
ncbi:MAG: hypothetical protein IJQ80_09170, partial [Clostridia bacterium]|nr:hypothetical protein [Clostridia bacterium]